MKGEKESGWRRRNAGPTRFSSHPDPILRNEAFLKHTWGKEDEQRQVESNPSPTHLSLKDEESHWDSKAVVPAAIMASLSYLSGKGLVRDKWQ